MRFGLQHNFSIFGLPTKLIEMTLKRCRTVLCFAHEEGASVVVVMCYDRRARSAFLSRNERSKFATPFFDFWAPYEVGRNDTKTGARCSLLAAR